jgi:uncharacterized protein YeaO (DUF488 family)
MSKKAKRARAPTRKAKRPAKAKTEASIEIKRAYDAPSENDGLRILVDRVWPRGMKKTKLKIDLWPKHLAPSTELRKWYQHDPERFNEFRRRYLAELKENGESLAELRAALRGHKVTLLTATRELDLSQARVLREVLK